jgi:hypothetical protein
MWSRTTSKSQGLTGRSTKPLESYRSTKTSIATEAISFCRPDDQPCGESQEFDLVRNMLIAAVEERYKDAGELTKNKQLCIIAGMSRGILTNPSNELIFSMVFSVFQLSTEMSFSCCGQRKRTQYSRP